MAYKVISTQISTKELLDQSAAELMAERGEKFSVRDVCQRAGVSVGTFYTYYKSKDEICLERVRYMDQYLVELAAERLTGSPADKLAGFLVAYLERSIARGMTFSREVYKSILLSETTPEQARQRHFYRLVRGLLEEGQEQGDFAREYSAEELADMTVAFARGLASDWCHRGGQFDLAEFGKRACSIWVRGLK